MSARRMQACPRPCLWAEACPHRDQHDEAEDCAGACHGGPCRPVEGAAKETYRLTVEVARDLPVPQEMVVGAIRSQFGVDGIRGMCANGKYHLVAGPCRPVEEKPADGMPKEDSTAGLFMRHPLAGEVCRWLCQMMADETLPVPAANNIELRFTSAMHGDFLVTVQRAQWKSPGELKARDGEGE